jgi:hypothetical protein
MLQLVVSTVAAVSILGLMSGFELPECYAMKQTAQYTTKMSRSSTTILPKRHFSNLSFSTHSVNHQSSFASPKTIANILDLCKKPEAGRLNLCLEARLQLFHILLDPSKVKLLKYTNPDLYKRLITNFSELAKEIPAYAMIDHSTNLHRTVDEAGPQVAAQHHAGFSIDKLFSPYQNEKVAKAFDFLSTDGKSRIQAQTVNLDPKHPMEDPKIKRSIMNKIGKRKNLPLTNGAQVLTTDQAVKMLRLYNLLDSKLADKSNITSLKINSPNELHDNNVFKNPAIIRTDPGLSNVENAGGIGTSYFHNIQQLVPNVRYVHELRAFINYQGDTLLNSSTYATRDSYADLSFDEARNVANLMENLEKGSLLGESSDRKDN